MRNGGGGRQFPLTVRPHQSLLDRDQLMICRVLKVGGGTDESLHYIALSMISESDIQTRLADAIRSGYCKHFWYLTMLFGLGRRRTEGESVHVST